jgi:hypothetical protein
LINGWDDRQGVDEFLQRLRDRIAEVEERLGDRLATARKDLYKPLLDRRATSCGRTDGWGAVTIVHGDANIQP